MLNSVAFSSNEKLRFASNHNFLARTALVKDGQICTFAKQLVKKVAPYLCQQKEVSTTLQ